MSNQIQINQQLMEREDRLVEVFELERQINAILGGDPFPLAPPDGLPSLQKRKKPARKAAAPAAAPLRLRKLDLESESAYRIVYRDGELEKTEIHLDPKPLTALASTPLPHIDVLRIETVRCEARDRWETVEQLLP
ncbi:hypothetical protein [Pontiella sp.]|uniref:hypothetical protein n=1 Tax=Pontiella sp. TaxID=2837462 RepID=UPI003568A254